MGLRVLGFLIFQMRDREGSTSRMACSSDCSSTSVWKKPM